MDTDSRLTPLPLKVESMDEQAAAIASSSTQPITYTTPSNMISAPLHQSSISSNSSASSVSGRDCTGGTSSSGGRKSKKDKPVSLQSSMLECSCFRPKEFEPS